jgi:hypothetical protein
MLKLKRVAVKICMVLLLGVERYFTELTPQSLPWFSIKELKPIKLSQAVRYSRGATCGDGEKHL